MADGGEAYELISFAIVDNPNQTVIAPQLALSSVQDCCFILDVFALIGDADPFKNDHKEFIYSYGAANTGTLLVIQKCVDDEFEDQVTIVDQSFGTFSDFGVFTTLGLKYISLFLTFIEIILVKFHLN